MYKISKGEATPTIGLLLTKEGGMGVPSQGKMVTAPDSRSDANCATILVSIAEWVQRRGAQSDTGILEGLTT